LANTKKEKMSEFKEFGLKPELVEAVESLGFKEAMPIQEQVIPILVEKMVDLVGLAQTGTGKTAAYGLPILQNIDTNLREVQAVILSPTRELCVQIAKDMKSYASFMSDMFIVPVYGGASIETQSKELARKPQVVVATPGRLRDMIRRQRVKLADVKYIVLDEADEMLDMGFQEEVDDILKSMPEERTVLLFSATMPAEVEKILDKYMTDPIKVSVGKRNSGTLNVKHHYYLISAKDRYSVLKRLIDYTPSIYGIVFCRTKIETQEVADNLIHDGYNAAALHGDLSQVQRDLVMNHFRQGYLQILVATDVAARGLDVNNLTHVINYNLPDDTDTYVHRSGRTGRADKTGICLSLVHMREKGKLRAIEKQLGQPIEKTLIPTGQEVCEKQLFNHIDRLEKVDINRDDIDDFLPVVFKKLSWLSREELITRVVALNFNRFLDYYKNAIDLNVIDSKDDRDGGKSSKKRSKREKFEEKGGYNDEGLERIFIGIGKRDGVKPNKLIGMINDVTNTRNIRIGRIELTENYSIVAVDEKSVQTIINCFADPALNPNGIRVKRDTGDTKPKPRDRRDGDRRREKRSFDSDRPERRNKSRFGDNRERKGRRK